MLKILKNEKKERRTLTIGKKRDQMAGAFAKSNSPSKERFSKKGVPEK